MLAHTPIIQTYITPDMTLSPVLLTTLAACWILPALIIAAKYAHDRFRTSETVTTPVPPYAMERIEKEVTVRVTLQEVADASLYRYDRELLSVLSNAQITSTTYSVTDTVPYAQASVLVLNEHEETVARRCTLCMN